MPSKLEELKAKALARRHALAANLGLDSAAQLTEALHSKSERRKLLDEKNQIFENRTGSHSNPLKKKNQSKSRDEKKSSENSKKEKEREEPGYTDSSTFLKGTNSNNPHNDYCQNFIDTGQVGSSSLEVITVITVVSGQLHSRRLNGKAIRRISEIERFNREKK